MGQQAAGLSRRQLSQSGTAILYSRSSPYLFQTKISFSEPLVKRTTLLIFSVFLTSALALCQSAPQQTAKKLTIEGIFAEGGITGRAPETIKWSPDNKKISFVQRDDSGEHGQLWYVDATTGER